MENKRLQLFALYLINALGIIIYLFNLVSTPFDLTFGTLMSGIYWFVILLIPSVIPVFFKNKIWRYITFIFGLFALLINLFIGIGYILDEQFQFGSMIILYWGFFGAVALVNSFKWIRSNG